MKISVKEMRKVSKTLKLSDEILEIIDESSEMTRGDLQARVEAFVRINLIK